MADTDCGWCGRLAYMEAASALTLAPTQWAGTVIQAAYKCPSCHRLNIAQEPAKGTGSYGAVGGLSDAQNYDWGSSVTWQPKKGQAQDFPDVPEHIALAAKPESTGRVAG